MPLVGARSALPSNPVVHSVVEANARSQPDQTAVVCGERQLTYRELNEWSNRFAHYLTASGIGRGDLVGVCQERSIELVVSILGVLKSGAAYVPLDPTYPAPRMQAMIAQLPQMRLVVVSERTQQLPIGSGGPGLVRLDEPIGLLDGFATSNPAVDVRCDDLCYAVFTSGSTGVPKATAIRHEGWYNLLDWLRVEYELDATSSDLVVSSFGFDITQRSLMAPLFTGATGYLLPSLSFDVVMAYRMIAEHGIRTLHCAPSTLYLLVDLELRSGGDGLQALQYLFIGGEKLAPARITEWATRQGNTCVLLHQYGVAECTDVASSYAMSHYSRYLREQIPVGRPVYNTQIHIMDPDLNDLREEEIGEICISGTSVGAGYLNAAAAEQDRFTTVERDGEVLRLYRTGDRGYVTGTGKLMVVGRVDAQVKIRGMRMDLGDIEHAVRQHPDVRDAVVLTSATGDGEAELLAFVIPVRPPIEPRRLRGDLLKSLPHTMVPQSFQQMSAFPLNPNGKIDRLALASRSRTQAVAGTPRDLGVVSSPS
jgi:amino acid adenylation domain-containing protein